MKKLSLDALKEKAVTIASDELLNNISGGNEDDCHPGEQVQKMHHFAR